MSLKIGRRTVIAAAVIDIFMAIAIAAHAHGAPHDTRTLNEQRYHYERAKIALAKDDIIAFDEHYSHLATYPLTPYLDYAKLKPQLNALSLDTIDEFLTQNNGSYLEQRLRRQLVFKLAQAERWADLVYYYTDQVRSNKLVCAHLYARYKTGDAAALDKVAEIWAQGKSHPKACDPLFKVWQNHGLLTDDIAWQRFNAAMKHSKRSLARYVQSLLSDNYQPFAQRYWQVDARPELIRHPRKFAQQSPAMQDIIAFAIKKYARKNPVDAQYYWERYEAQQLFAPELNQETKLYIVKQLIRKGFGDQARDVIRQSPSLRQAAVIERLIREALAKKDWNNVYHGILSLPTKHAQSDRWRYWLARAEVELNVVDAQNRANNTYRDLANKRSFYGFLAADRIHGNYSLENKPLEIPLSSRQAVASNLSLLRAKELWLTGHNSEAQAEWMFATKQLSARELAAAGALAKQWGWYNKGIDAMIAGNHWDHLSVRFPLAYQADIERVSSDTDVDETFIYAIARQESAFAEAAKSSSGAMGLMQIMPATAKATARKSGIAHRKEDLFRPEHNITIGGHYLDELLAKYQGNRILAAAAYNAGPYRVKRWQHKTDAALDYDIWIETIPFRETRHYVQNVLSFSVIYSYRLGAPKKLITESEANRLL